MKEIKLWRIASMVLIGLGLLYIVSDLVYDYFRIRWFLLEIETQTTMIFGCFFLTWGILVWAIFKKK